MASTAPPAKAEAAGAPPAVEAERANDAERVATADLRAERQKRLPSPWTPDEPFSTNARSDDARDEHLTVPSEERCTQLAARVLRATAELCGTPLSVTIAALVYLVVFYERPENTHVKDSPQDVVPACVLLASKIEEKPTRVSDVVNAMQRVLYPLRSDPLFLKTERARLAHAAADAARRENRAESGEPFAPAGIGAPAEPPSPKTRFTFLTKGEKATAEGGVDEKTVRVVAKSGDEKNADAPNDVAARLEPKETTARVLNAQTKSVSREEEEKPVTQKNQPPAPDSNPEALRSAYLRDEIARLKKKHPGLMPKSLYASALSRWRDAPTNPESAAWKTNTESRETVKDTENQTFPSRPERAEETNKPTRGKRVPASFSELETKTSLVKDKSENTRRGVHDEGLKNDGLQNAVDANFARSRPVIGDAYYETKNRVLRAEQGVLKAIDAEVNVVRVTSVLLNVARALNAPKSVTKLALVALTDFLFETTTNAARGLFFGSEKAEDDTSAETVPARTPLEFAGDVSAAAMSVAARLCGYALITDERGFARWTREREEKDCSAKEGSSSAEEARVGKRKRAFRDETRLDVSRGDTGRGDTCFPAPWWVEMEFDPKRVERVEKEMLRVLVRGAERSGAFLGE
uniref:Cyclin N-terminal domain-containing protein n=1 Tax=Micromonas pusilla TaxID=38833 RepID=A0A7S0DAG1_MICPS